MASWQSIIPLTMFWISSSCAQGAIAKKEIAEVEAAIFSSACLHGNRDVVRHYIDSKDQTVSIGVLNDHKEVNDRITVLVTPSGFGGYAPGIYIGSPENLRIPDEITQSNRALFTYDKGTKRLVNVYCVGPF